MVVNKSTLKEEINNNKLRIACESLSVEESDVGVVASGLALPLNKVSRNDFTYVTESIENTYKSLIGAPVLFNHNSDMVIGHVKDARMTEAGLEYTFDLDPNDKIAQKVKRKDLTKVSIQCMFDDEKSKEDSDGVTHAYITEFLELSVVSIPGFADTTIQLQEKLRDKKNHSSQSNGTCQSELKTNKPMGELMDKDKNQEQENPLDAVMAKVANGDKLSEDEMKLLSAAVDASKSSDKEESKEASDEEDDKYAELMKQIKDVSERLEALESVDKNPTEEVSDDEEDKDKAKEESDEEEDDKDSQEEKAELKNAQQEALKGDRKTISTEGTSKSKVQLTERDIRDGIIASFA